MYHGTERKRGQRMINCKRMEITRGENHWLGDGSYFYKEDVYAYRWIYNMYAYKYPNVTVDHETLTQKYMIIKADLNVNQERIFSFMNAEHKQLFNSVVEECKKRLKDIQIVDGAILNFMFDKMNYNEKFDAVIAVFMHEDSKMNSLNARSRLSFIPEIQICVKNINVVENMEELDISKDKNRLLYFSENFSTIAGQVIQKSSRKYVARRNKIKYKK